MYVRCQILPGHFGEETQRITGICPDLGIFAQHGSAHRQDEFLQDTDCLLTGAFGHEHLGQGLVCHETVRVVGLTEPLKTVYKQRIVVNTHWVLIPLQLILVTPVVDPAGDATRRVRIAKITFVLLTGSAKRISGLRFQSV